MRKDCVAENKYQSEIENKDTDTKITWRLKNIINAFSDAFGGCSGFLGQIKSPKLKY